MIEAYIRTIGDVPLMVHRARKRLAGVIKALKDQEERQWLAACREDSRASYETYATAWLSGAHLQQARKRIAEIAEADAWVAKGFVKIHAVGDDGAKESRWIEPGSGVSFREMVGGPEMVIVPSGSFTMGTTDEEIAALTEAHGDYFKYEAPQHCVTIPQPFAIGKCAITRGQFAQFVIATGHKTEEGAHVFAGGKWKFDPSISWRAPGFKQDNQHPVICVSWEDAKAFVAWLSQETRLGYRLPAEAEWEYAARAGTTTPFRWDGLILQDDANYPGNHAFGCRPTGMYIEMTEPVTSVRPNAWGLYQVHGNVWEWCEDKWHENYTDKPEALKTTGGAWATEGDNARVLRGGSWYIAPDGLVSANRIRYPPDNRYDLGGFRVARTL